MSWKKQNLETDLEQRKVDLKSQLEKITRFTENETKRHYRCKGYYREIGTEYDREKFAFAPDDLVIDKHGLLSICVGVAHSPDILEGDVLWMFSEGDSEIHYISECIPEILKREYRLAA